MNQITVCKIALPTPLWKSFDYLPPHNGQQFPVGVRVCVPFGARTLVGIFLGFSNHTEIDPRKLKSVQAVLDTQSLFSANLFKLCCWASEYYHHPLGEVLINALPKKLRQGKEISLNRINIYSITSEGEAALIVGIKRSPKQAETLARLKDASLNESQLKNLEISKPIINKLINNGWAKLSTQEIENKPLGEGELALTLNAAQAQSLKSINEAAGFTTFLLAGVTGSGKTEVYLQSIDAVLKKGQQALVLVPEISLTPQTVSRFKARFKTGIAVMHSGLGDQARASMWSQAYHGKASIVIGTRSAIFAPLDNLGIIIVDEEHDLSFKSQSQVRYSARDMAVMRAQIENVPVVLGSATPSLESFYNVKRDRYQLLKLPMRAGKAKPPQVRVVNLCNQSLKAGLSRALITAITEQLAKKKQVLIFLNRRGYAPMMLCHHCGYTISCARCDAKLILHANPHRLVCHHCDKVVTPPRICPKCHQTELMSLGQGTEQLETVLTELFPQHNVLRIDRDTTQTRHSLSEKIEQINAGRADILIGTQMLAKGHHFPNLGLSAIVDADSGFFSLDFRAIERMAQLLIQVSGRSGRSCDVGEVIIQTHHPEHPYLKILLQQGYFALMEQLLTEREKALLPPYSFQVMLRAEAIARQKPFDFLNAAKAFFDKKAIEAYGPMPALMERKAGRFRAQLLLQSQSRQSLKLILEPITKEIASLPQARDVRWSIDVDPTDVL